MKKTYRKPQLGIVNKAIQQQLLTISVEIAEGTKDGSQACGRGDSSDDNDWE